MDDIFNNVFDLLSTEDDSEMESPNSNLNIRSMSVGEEFVVNGIEFIRLGYEQGGILCVTKNSMFRSIFHNTSNNYQESVVRQKILDEFVPRLEGIDLIPFEMDLIAMNGERNYGKCADEAGLLTMDLFRKYREYIPFRDGEQFTCTPFSCMEEYPYVVYVSSSGSVYNNYAGYALRCRPACIFAI